MEMIHCLNVSKAIKGRQLFHIDKQVLNQGDKIGLIGKNGAGKSTLLKMLAGLDTNYTGKIFIHSDLAYLPQLKKRTKESGGEQVKRMLEEIFSKTPQCLLLDEPSSHLDGENIEWLIEQLVCYPGALIIVSHDRYLLNQVVSDIWELDKGQLAAYAGNYDNYQEVKEKEAKAQEIAYLNYKKKVRQLKREEEKRRERAENFKRKKKKVSASDYKVNSYAGKYDSQQKSIAKSAKALQKRRGRLQPVESPHREDDYTFKAVGNLASEGKQTLLHLEAGEVRVADHLLFALPTFKLKAGDKVGLQGANQTGKSSFLRQLFQHDLSGYYMENLSIGYFSQNFEHLKLEETLLKTVQKDSLQADGLIRNVLASLGFDASRIADKVGHLSGGERVRLAFAQLLLGNHHLLLLDEPTNYLDLPTLAQVESFIKNHPAAMIIVSHDETFMNNTVNRHYVIENHQLLSPDYRKGNSDNYSKEISLLEFRLQQLIAEGEAELEEIRSLQEKIKELKEVKPPSF